MAVFENIDRLQKQYTDKYVLVDETRPELRRFRGLTGTVKTVNLSGRALVQFDGHNNIGWFDIDPVFLKVIDQPLPKPEEKPKKEAKPAAKAEKAVPAKGAPEKAAAKPAAGPAATGKSSVADILAAARGGAKPAAKAEAAPAAAAPKVPTAAKAAVDPKKMSMADILAAARGGAKAAPVAEAATAPMEKKSTAELMEAARTKPAGAGVPPLGGPKKPPEGGTPAPAPAKVDPAKMSVADILAAARGKGGGAAAAAPAPPKQSPAAKPEPEPEPAAETPVEEAVPAEAAAGSIKSMKDAFKTVGEIVAYCRKVDSK
jgi:hypothetical protein